MFSEIIAKFYPLFLLDTNILFFLNRKCIYKKVAKMFKVKKRQLIKTFNCLKPDKSTYNGVLQRFCSYNVFNKLV